MSSILKQVVHLLDVFPQLSLGASEVSLVIRDLAIGLPASSSTFSQSDLISGFFYLIIALLVYIVIRVWTSRKEES